MTEVWVPLVDSDGNHGDHYEISSHGRIRSLDRVCIGKNGGRYPKKGKIIKTVVGAKGYPVFIYRVGGVQRIRIVSRLMAYSFLGQPTANDMQACHNDGERENNVITNIRWGTPKENAADKILHGTALHGEQHPRSKITAEIALEIVRLCRSGMRQTDVAKQMGASDQIVSRIMRGISWSRVTGIEPERIAA